MRKHHEQGLGVAVTPKVSVVMVTYYTGPLLWRALRSLLDQPEVAEIILIDNGNWPETVEEIVNVASREPRIKLITGQGNIGFSKACNLGVGEAVGNTILLFNPDAVMPRGGIGQLFREAVGAAGEEDTAGHWVVGGRLVNTDGTEQPGARRETLTPWRAMVEMARIDRLAPRHPYFRRFNNHQAPRPDGTIPTPVISGACMLMPLAAWDLIGGMDEDYFLHAEDVDFCLRFAEAGGAVYFCPHVDILHQKSSSRANRIVVERRKAQSLNRYFRRHFSTQYPKGFVTVVSGLVWGTWALRSAKIMAGRGLSLLGLNRRRGLSGVSRALRSQRISRHR